MDGKKLAQLPLALKKLGYYAESEEDEVLQVQFYSANWIYLSRLKSEGYWWNWETNKLRKGFTKKPKGIIELEESIDYGGSASNTSKQEIANQNQITAWKDGRLTTRTDSWNTTKYWSKSNQLLNDFGITDKIGKGVSLNPNTGDYYSYDWNRGSHSLMLYSSKTIEELPCYQLTVYNNGKQFSTLVYLTNDEFNTIQSYRQIHEKRMAQERKRKTIEQQVMRSFSVTDLGIYNWGRIYKPSDLIVCEADFKIEGISAINEVAIFLITGENGNAVSKYSKDTWNRFTFSPSDSNALLAILPNNQIALVNQTNFAQLNFAKIRKEGKLNLKLKPSATIHSVDSLKNLLQQ